MQVAAEQKFMSKAGYMFHAAEPLVVAANGVVLRVQPAMQSCGAGDPNKRMRVTTGATSDGDAGCQILGRKVACHSLCRKELSKAAIKQSEEPLDMMMETNPSKLQPT